MSEEQTEQAALDTPPQGDEAPPQVDPISPPEPATEDVQPVGRTPQAEAGEPPSDQEQGVGVAPTEPGDAGEGFPGTRFETTEEVEAKQAGNSDDVAGAI